MRIPRTIESRIVEYFQTAPLEATSLLFGIIQGIQKTRKPADVRKTFRKAKIQPEACSNA